MSYDLPAECAIQPRNVSAQDRFISRFFFFFFSFPGVPATAAGAGLPLLLLKRILAPCSFSHTVHDALEIYILPDSYSTAVIPGDTIPHGVLSEEIHQLIEMFECDQPYQLLHRRRAQYIPWLRRPPSFLLYLWSLAL